MIMDSAIVSVIIPIYNAALYLSKCLNSVLNQTYKKIEVICVNDGSTDNSLEIIRNYAERDKRVIVINENNLGVSYARNMALQHTQGEFILYVDADDWIDSNCIELLLKYGIDHQCDIVMYPYIREHVDFSLKRHLFNGSQVLKGQDCKRLARRMIGPIKDEIMSPVILDSYGTVWGKLYRKKVIEGLQFVDLSIIGTAEDSLFNMFAFKRAEAIGYYHDVFYHYRKDNKSSITNVNKSCLKEKRKALYSIIRKHFVLEEEQEALTNRIALGTFGLLVNAYVSDEPTKEINNILFDEDINKSLQRFDTKCLSIHWRLFFNLVKRKQCKLIVILLYVIQKIRRK